jgi:hypothetical protein
LVTVSWRLIVVIVITLIVVIVIRLFVVVSRRRGRRRARLAVGHQSDPDCSPTTKCISSILIVPGVAVQEATYGFVHDCCTLKALGQV